ncbi:Disease resistance protein [Vigna angularis]|uniref:Disease resistance protein n=1 Tax=Phaseolus angularis TaxID=3914 RepID=A0A8T0JRB5_PHAAN|nr:uncharacterized protein LOC108347357 [Vigna angularis]XP_017442013.1 uncharacterized protein LOC108347357 [Vigna angularis]XP_017442014.1 uncharacterized protein LOC108347357 [Vigna angularis]XP_052724258.1 uncharacterized protein LOC108347357 [Vigna angularis]KAG2380283.1 Disease resistance protein [Vigna angularis]
MDFLGPFGKVVEGLVDFVWKHGVRQVTYIVNYNNNVVELKDSVKDLALEKERINHQRDEAEKNLNNIEGKVIEWDRKVSEIETTVEVFKNDDGHTRARSPNCFVFPYLWNRHRLGRQAHKMKEDVKRLIGESPELDEVFYRQNVTSNDATLSNCGFVEFSSIKSIIEKVMIQLQDSAVRMIGLYGRGGVGKSTLVKEIARKAKEKKLFDVVVKVEITADPNPHKIQEEIAYVLGLRLEGEGENVRADCLRRRLKKEKGNILLILDDLWHKLDLNKLGIPVEDYDDDEDFNRQKPDNKDGNNDPSSKLLKKENIAGGHKGCKILLTSRDKNVLCAEMDVKSTFCVRELDDKDALMLFQKLTGIHNEMPSSKQEIVKKYCEGLPMAIVVVARALRNKSESVWEATIKRHKKHELVGDGTSMDISVKMSYEHLENEEIKYIFLLCAQMGRRALIMDLVKYSFGLGILEGVSSLWEAREKIKTSIQKLKDSGLLLDESSNNHFNMHDMVRDTALSIAHKYHNTFNLRNGKLDDWPELEKCTSIFMCNSDIIDGLEVINCPQLKLFQIDTNDPYLKIPKSFFRRMKNLRVLIMTGFCVSNLPSSIQYLSKLRMLCLQRCTLDCNLSIIGKLKKLRILSFSGSILKSLPIELQCLDKLRMLDISDCSELKIIPPNVISSLTCLEELYIRESLIKMLVERETNKGQDLFLSELKNLHQLKVVELSIPCVSNFPNHLFFDKLRDYNIVIGDFDFFSLGEFKMLNKHETFRVLAVQLKDNTIIHSQENIKLLFKTVQTLLLGKTNGVREVVNDLNIDGFQDLEHLSIINNNDFKYVNSTKLCNYVNVFPNLESLRLYNLGKLDMICYGPVTVVSFAKLRIIKVEMCHRLKNLYSLDMIMFPIGSQTCDISECNSYMDIFLSSLEIIEVSECKSLKEILQIPKHYGKVEFLKLHTLTLRLLPLLSSFYTKVDKFCWPDLTKAQTRIMGHKDLTSEEDKQSDEEPPLFGELVEIPNLETLNLSSLKIHKIWSDQNSSSFIFQNLIKLVVKDCDKLTHLCSLSMARSLKKLKSLVISECPVMEKIFETERNSADKVCIFPKLEEIHLTKMNKLTDIWQTKVSADSFSSLISVKIEECNKLDKIFPSHMEGWFETLDNLKVYRCESVEVIFEINDSQEIDEFGGIDTKLQIILLEHLPKLKQLWSTDPNGILNFKKLRTIDVCFCHELKNLFPVSVAKDVPKLEHMSVLYCDKMEEIVASQDALETNKDLLVFPELTSVRLHCLPDMKYFYKKKYPIKCPKLKELSVTICLKLKTFVKDTINTTNKVGNFVFSIDEVFPNLERMEFDFDEAQQLLPKYQMHRLKELTLNSVKSVDLLNQFPYRIPNLEKLKFNSCYFKELAPKANIGRQKGLGIVLQLKELIFSYSNIKDLGFERGQVLQRLEILRLEGCYKLSNLAPPSVSLIYLTHLELKDCHRLKNLMASSTAKSMVQLKTMKVIDCHKIEQIISMEESEEGKVMKIVFSKLISIELVGLKKLASFCSHKECEFEFSSLEILIVRECEKMEKFSEKRSIAPKLKNIFGVEGDEKTKWQWEGDLNATIHKIFNDKITFTYSELLDTEDSTEFIEQLWQGRHWVQQNSFGYLKRLCVWECHTIVHVIPSHLLSCFHNLEELYVYYCSNAEVIFKMNDDNRVIKKPSGLFRLKSLYLSNLPQLKHVWDKDPKEIIDLDVLEKMRVNICRSLTTLFPASVAKDLTGLEVFKVTECEKLEEIFRKDERSGEEEGSTQEFVFHRLTTLTLRQLPRLKYSIHCSKQQESTSNLSERDVQELCFGSQVIPNSNFCLLESLKIDGCQFLSDVLLPFNLLLSLTNLEKLKVENCKFIKTIFDVKCTTESKDVTSIGPTHFYLKNLSLSNLPNLKNVWNEDPHGILRMHHLEEVHLEKCEGLRSVFPASIAKDIVELKTVEIEDCEGLMTIVEENNNNADARGTNEELPCPWVRSLKLNGLSMFKYFYYCSLQCHNFAHLESHTENQVGTEKIKWLSLGNNGVEMILHGEFQRNFLDNLKVLTLCLLSDAFGYEIVEQVPNIEKLVVSDGSLKEMFCCQSSNNEDYSGLLLLLKELRLESLKELVSIGLENSWTEPFVRNLETFEVISCSSLKNLVTCRVSFSNLICLKVENCDSLLYLFTSSTAKSLTKLQRMEIEKCKSIEEIVSEEREESDEDEIIFPKLNCLKLKYLENLVRFYKGSLSFPLLEELSMSDCDKMVSLCPGTLEASKLSQVIPLEIDLRSTLWEEFMSKIGRRSSLEFKDRTDLEEIWRVSLEIHDFCFSNLETLVVDGCQLLSYVIPFGVLPLLSELQTLEVGNCDSVKTIFDVKYLQDTITFSLKKLVLLKLPNLETVWNEEPAEIVTEPNPVDPEQTNPKLITPNLEHLTVGENELKMIVDGKFQRNLLHKLKVLGLCFDIECDEFPEYGFLQQLPNVMKLEVSDSSFKVIFCLQRPNNSEILLQLKKLRLESLQELVSIGLENSWTEPFVRNLETFEVISCSNLKNLVPCQVSFSNLICLKVEKCDSLSYLFTSSTAKSLAKLQRMEIKECESIEEIVSKEEEESDEDEIIFPKLNCLKLKSLKNLLSFYKGSLNFPLLEELSIRNCDDMVSLCGGTLEASKLSEVKLEGSNTTLETGLNSTMKMEFLKQISKREELGLESRPGLQEIWNGSLHIPDLCFSELAKLTVNDCRFLSDAVLPFHLLPLLPRLKTLEVGNCDPVRTIFDVKCTTKDTSITFPLKKLVLSKLPNLENVWNEDPHRILCMQHLEEIHVKECKGLKSVFPASAAKSLVELEDLVVEDCEGLMAIVADESKEGDELDENGIIFPRLSYLKVESCNSLPYLFTSSTAKGLAELKTMKIKECKSIQEIVSKEGKESDKDEEIIFKQLQDLYLEKLDELGCFYSGNLTLTLPSLEEVYVIKCSSMKTFSAVNKINHPTKWYCSEYERPQKESDLNSAVLKTSAKEAPDASSSIISVLQ